ncbi:N-acetyltransferase eso1 [Termitomyces sp. T112]|nr:N-acetyltransferase eso1 [Termitomyces sp. T112]
MQVPWKGKGKATDQDFEDLDPIITYRHLHSQNLGVRDPLRVIALCDSDAFYAACEMVRLGVDESTPLVVLQWDALIAINYPARKFGITRLKKYNMKELQAKHPELKIVHVATYKEGERQPGYWNDVDTKTHKVSLDYYRRESSKIAAKFRECLPRVEVEKASIDEAFFDFSKRVREVLLERYPYLAQVPSNASNGADTPLPPPPPFSWNDIKHSIVIPIHPALPEGDMKASIDSICNHQREEALLTWHDIALSIGAELMETARRQVHEQLGYSTSAGIARNKFLAKLTASYKKPNNQSILRNAAIPEYLRPLPFQKIRFLGGKLGTAIASEFEAATVQDLLSISLEEMQRKLGEESIWIYEVLRGIDRSEVKEKKTTINKSMLASKNLPRPITNASEGFHWIRVLAAELALRLVEAREISTNLWPKSIVLRVRRGYNAGQSKQATFPYTPEVTVDTVAAAGNMLWKDLVGTDLAMKVTNVSLAFTGIEVAEHGQRSIEGFLEASQSTKRQRDENGNDDGWPVSLTGLVDADYMSGDNVPADDPCSGLHMLSFKCSRCGQRLSVPSLGSSSRDGEEQLAALRLEHDDFHFAQDLAKEFVGEPTTVLRPSAGGVKHVLKPLSRNSPKKRSRKKELQGIEQFFRRP